MILIGTVGTGKSGCAKSLTARLTLLGYKTCVLTDAKGEWGIVSLWLGGKVIRVGPGRTTRLNPLDEGIRPSTDTEGKPLSRRQWAQMVRARRLALLTTLTQILLNGRSLEPDEHTCLTRALDTAVEKNTIHTLAHIVEAIRNPTIEVREEIGNAGYHLGHALLLNITGDVAGMFDGESTESFDPHTPMFVIDTSALRGASEEAKK